VRGKVAPNCAKVGAYTLCGKLGRLDLVAEKDGTNMTRVAIAIVASWISLLCLSAMSAPSQSVGDPCASPDPRAPNQFWTDNSWIAFNARRYEDATNNVDACLDRWLPAAERIQRGFAARKEACPPVGRTSDAQVKAAIFANGPLNDVATNLWIKGRSHVELGKNDAARIAFRSCARLRCARTWDASGGWFWAPAADCADRLASLP
jgi:hypothetical protein